MKLLICVNHLLASSTVDRTTCGLIISKTWYNMLSIYLTIEHFYKWCEKLLLSVTGIISSFHRAQHSHRIEWKNTREQNVQNVVIPQNNMDASLPKALNIHIDITLQSVGQYLKSRQRCWTWWVRSTTWIRYEMYQNKQKHQITSLWFRSVYEINKDKIKN